MTMDASFKMADTFKYIFLKKSIVYVMVGLFISI